MNNNSNKKTSSEMHALDDHVYSCTKKNPYPMGEFIDSNSVGNSVQ